MYKLCIFDLDGTLADTLDSIAYSANLALQALGFEKQPTDAFRYYAGDGVYELIKRCLYASGDKEGKQAEKLLSKYREYFSEYCMYHVKPYEGICELLDELKKRKVQIAVLSNKPHNQTIDVVETLFGKGYFDYVQGQIEGIPRKPDPTGALRIADMAQIEPKHCLYIGDTNTDMQTGNSARMHTAGVLWGFRDRKELEENHAENVVEYPREILKILEERQND